MIALFLVVGTVQPGDFVYVLPMVSMVGVATAMVIFMFSYKRRRY